MFSNLASLWCKGARRGKERKKEKLQTRRCRGLIGARPAGHGRQDILLVRLQLASASGGRPNSFHLTAEMSSLADGEVTRRYFGKLKGIRKKTSSCIVIIWTLTRPRLALWLTLHDGTMDQAPSCCPYFFFSLYQVMGMCDTLHCTR